MSASHRAASCTDAVAGTVLERVLRRDRVVVLTSLGAIAAIAWAYVLWLAVSMGVFDAAAPTGDMAGMDMGAAVAPGFRPWTMADFGFTFTMWAIMMVAMMTPSVAPVVLLYSSVGRRAREGGKPIASTGWFFAGYLLVWVAFSIAATVTQWLLAGLALLSPTMTMSSGVLGGIILIVAGIYQWTSMKDVCLRQCQSPIAFLTSHGGFRSAPAGALRLGIEHGVYCLGCCWALMALLFVGGIMNVVWIAGIAILILLEKTVRTQRLVPRLAGALLAAAGVWLLVGAF